MKTYHIAPAVVAGLGLVALSTSCGMAASPSDSNVHQSRAAAHVAAVHHRHMVIHRAFGGAPVYGAGYIYEPRRGIVDEACNLPTSSCPNDQRDVQ